MSGGGHTHSHCYRDIVQLEISAHLVSWSQPRSLVRTLGHYLIHYSSSAVCHPFVLVLMGNHRGKYKLVEIQRSVKYLSLIIMDTSFVCIFWKVLNTVCWWYWYIYLGPIQLLEANDNNVGMYHVISIVYCIPLQVSWLGVRQCRKQAANANNKYQKH